MDFECNVCKACGCGTTLFNSKGVTVPKVSFQQNPVIVYCSAHIPQLAIVTATLKDDQVLTTEQKINYLNNY